MTSLARMLSSATVALPLVFASHVVYAGPVGAGGPLDAVRDVPTVVTQIHARKHARCYLHLKYPSLACHKHVKKGGKWIMQVCPPADCESITIRGGKRTKSKVYGD